MSLPYLDLTTSSLFSFLKNCPVTNKQKEIAEAVHSLSCSEASNVIDSVLNSAEGNQKTATLNPNQKEELRRTLLKSLPR